LPIISANFVHAEIGALDHQLGRVAGALGPLEFDLAAATSVKVTDFVAPCSVRSPVTS